MGISKKIIFPTLIFISLTLIIGDVFGTDQTLSERLGYKKSDKLLIINGDDAGMCHSVNMAIIDSLEKGLMTSASIMVPTPGYEEIVKYATTHPEQDFGLHITLTAEWESKRSPVSNPGDVYSLINPAGFFWPDYKKLNQHTLDRHVELEVTAQIERALADGIDITHLNSHGDSLKYPRKHIPVFLNLAFKYDLPVRLCSPWDTNGSDFNKKILADYGLVFPDYLVYEPYKKGETLLDHWKRLLQSLKPGVSELYIHPAIDSEEIREVAKPDWQIRIEEYRLFTHEEAIKKLIISEGIILIGYRQLRDLQRKSPKRWTPAISSQILKEAVIDRFADKELFILMLFILMGLITLSVPLIRRKNRLIGILFSPDKTIQGLSQTKDMTGALSVIAISILISIASLVWKTYSDMDAFAHGYSYNHAIKIIIFIVLFFPIEWLSKCIFIILAGFTLHKKPDWGSLLSTIGYTYIPKMLLGSIAMALAFCLGMGFHFSPWFSNVITPGVIFPGLFTPKSFLMVLLAQIDLLALWSLFLTAISIKYLLRIRISIASLIACLYYVLTMVAYYLIDKIAAIGSL